MTYGNVSSNLDVSRPEVPGIAAAVIDTRVVDQAGYKTDGQQKHYELRLKPGYVGNLEGGILLWGGYVLNARETLAKLAESNAYQNSSSSAAFMERLNAIANTVVNDHEAKYLARKNEELTQRFARFTAPGITAETRKVIIATEMDRIKVQAEQTRRHYRPEFCYIGFEKTEKQNPLQIHAIYDEEVRLPPENYYEFGLNVILKQATGSSGVMENDELKRQGLGGLSFNGVAGAIKYSDNILTGGTHAIITFKDRKISVVHRDYCSLITNAVTASMEGFPNYPRAQAISDIELILTRDQEARAEGEIDNAARLKGDADRLSRVAASLGDSLVNLMSGRMGKRIIRRRIELYQMLRN